MTEELSFRKFVKFPRAKLEVENTVRGRDAMYLPGAVCALFLPFC